MDEARKRALKAQLTDYYPNELETPGGSSENGEDDDSDVKSEASTESDERKEREEREEHKERKQRNIKEEKAKGNEDEGNGKGDGAQSGVPSFTYDELATFVKTEKPLVVYGHALKAADRGGKTFKVGLYYRDDGDEEFYAAAGCSERKNVKSHNVLVAGMTYESRYGVHRVLAFYMGKEPDGKTKAKAYVEVTKSTREVMYRSVVVGELIQMSSDTLVYPGSWKDAKAAFQATAQARRALERETGAVSEEQSNQAESDDASVNASRSTRKSAAARQATNKRLRESPALASPSKRAKGSASAEMKSPKKASLPPAAAASSATPAPAAAASSATRTPAAAASSAIRTPAAAASSAPRAPAAAASSATPAPAAAASSATPGPAAVPMDEILKMTKGISEIAELLRNEEDEAMRDHYSLVLEQLKAKQLKALE